MKDRVIFHVDVNSAFLSWSAVHALQHGASVDFREIPSVVGGNQATRHGIVLAKSIPSKEYGIKTGEPIIQAKQKCPGLVVVPPDYYCYERCSRAMNEILREYTDKVQIFSIDESFLDMTDTLHLFGNDPVEVATKIKDRIKNELGFTVSIGISDRNKLLAKMASELKKPDAVSTIYHNEIQSKMWPLPIRDLYMVGRATEKKLISMGITTIGDLANMDIEFVKYKLKPAWGTMLWNFSNGIEESPVKPEGSIPYIKGIGNSTTIKFDITEKKDAYKVLLSLTEMVAMRLRSVKYCCSVVSIWIRTNELSGYSHQKKLYVPTDETMKIYKSACRLFDEAWQGEPIRALGIRVSDLCSNDFVQLSLFENYSEKKRKLDRLVDGLRIEYGSHSIYRSCFLHSGFPPVTGGISEENNFVMTSILW